MGIKQKIATCLFLIGTICFVSFEYIGIEVDENGYLLEPFALIPLGYLIMVLTVLFLFIGLKEKNKPQFRDLLRNYFEEQLTFFIVSAFFITFTASTVIHSFF